MPLTIPAGGHGAVQRYHGLQPDDEHRLERREYAGQTIRASGFYLAYTLEDTGEMLHYIAQQDAAGCCSIALRFS